MRCVNNKKRTWKGKLTLTAQARGRPSSGCGRRPLGRCQAPCTGPCPRSPPSGRYTPTGGEETSKWTTPTSRVMWPRPSLSLFSVCGAVRRGTARASRVSKPSPIATTSNRCFSWLLIGWIIIPSPSSTQESFLLGVIFNFPPWAFLVALGWRLFLSYYRILPEATSLPRRHNISAGVGEGGGGGVGRQPSSDRGRWRQRWRAFRG